MDNSRIKRRERISPLVLDWIRDHRQQLHVSGWSASELYRRDRSKGIAWMRVWNKKDLSVTLSRDGSIKFQYVNESGKPITQTAFPKRMAGKKQITKLPVGPLITPPEVTFMASSESTIFHGLI